MRRGGLIGLACVLAAAAGAGSAAAGTVLVVKGRGWGHGVGMSQWGAKGFAEHGWTWQRILGHYYPGTTVSTAPQSLVRVLLAAGQPGASIGCAGALRVGDASGQGWRLPAGVYAVAPSLRLPVGRKRVHVRRSLRGSPHVRFVTVTRPLRSPLVVDCPSAPLSWNGRSYHGRIVLRSVGRRISTINTVPLDDYVRGVVGGEMPAGWPAAALAAQAVAARSYALAMLRPDRRFDVYRDTRSQVYGGTAYETARTNAAVSSTAGRILTWRGRVASTYFFSTSGGRTADVREVWQGAGYLPYLRSVPDPYDVRSPHHFWGPIALTGQRLRSVLNVAPGAISLVRTASGRVATISVGGRALAGERFRRAFGLASTSFDVGTLTLTASRAQVVYGRKVELLARADRVGTATLLRRRGSGPWKALAPVRAAMRVEVEPRARTQYRLSGGGVRGPVVVVAVAPQVRAAAAAATLLSGTVAPRTRGAITVLRLVAGAWRIVARPQLDGRGAFRAPLRLAPGGYRIVVAGDARLAGTTRMIHVTRRLLASFRRH